MLHFFRRIRQKLLANNQMKKYMLYAIGEIALVMIGILLALQINNWNEERTNRIEESEVLTDLKEDMLLNIKKLQRGIEVINDDKDEITHVLSTIKQKDPDHQALLENTKMFYHMRVATFDPVSGVINDILNSDKLNLIQDKVLRQHISNWDGLLEDTKEEELKVLDIKQDELRPYMLQCCPIRSGNIKDLEPLLSDFKFENILRVYFTQLARVEKDYQPVIKYIEELLIMIDENI
jgi:hypothetical protein